MDALGRHLLVEYYACNRQILDDVVAIESLLLQAARQARATIINATFHHFSPHGVSGVVVIQESHLAIHTWPEAGYAAVDLFTCGSEVNPWAAYACLKDGLQAGQGTAMDLRRGAFPLLPEHTPAAAPDSRPPAAYPVSRDLWFTDRSESLALSLKHQGRIWERQSPQQRVEVYASQAYGTLLALDGQIAMTQADHYIYDEMLVHVPMQVLPQARQVLLIGGGDGGAATELLRYPQLPAITVVEWDEAVVAAAAAHFPDLARSLRDPRVRLHLQDGLSFMQQAPAEHYDLILIDLPAGGPGLPAADLYASARRLLRPGGVVVAQSTSPRYLPERFQAHLRQQQVAFGHDKVHLYLAHVPTLPGGSWGFAFCARDTADPLAFEPSRSQAFFQQAPLRYYNLAVHRGAFALPNDVQAMLS